MAMRSKQVYFFPAVMLLLGLAGCSWGELQPAPNQAPVIHAVLLDGEDVMSPVVHEGQSILLQADVWDPNGDEFASDQIQWSVSDGILENDSGSSVVWTAPYVEWQNPPQDVRVTVTVEVTDGRETDRKSIEIKVSPPCSDANRPPVIKSIIADPDSIPLGNTTVITADVQDPDGDPLTFEWTVPFGYFDGSGPQITWTTTETCCRDWYTVQLVVSDGCKAVWGSTKVEVIP